MYLKSLTLKGFKSFVNKTQLDFERGVCCVVGPNGSGKSNISDALLFVLGERNPKNIRGDEVADCIFSGSKSKKAALSAEVSLTFGEAGEILGLDVDEIEITRHLFKSGESEYFLNGTRVRRLDILSVLRDSGLGVGTHSIISQGSIDAVLRLGESDLADVVEEAAGILQYRQRKAKSMAKLDSLTSTLDRIYDLKKEVKRQLAPIEKRAKRAQEVKKLKEEQTSIRCQIAVLDYKDAKSRLAKIDEKLTSQEIKRDAAKAKIDEIEKSIEKISEEIKQNSRSVSSSNALSLGLNDASNRLRGQIQLAENLKDNAKVSIERAKLERDEAFSLTKKYEEDLGSEEESLENLLDEIEKASKSLDEEMQKGTNLNNEISEFKEQLETSEKTLRSYRSQTEMLSEKIQEIDSLVAKNESTLEAVALQCDAKEKLLVEKNKELDEKRNRKETFASAFKKAKENVNRAETSLGECKSAKEHIESASLNARAQEESLKAQIDALAEISDKQDIDRELSAFIEESEKADPANILSKHISCDEEFEPFIELLLGDYINSLLSSSPKDIKTLEHELSSRDKKIAVPTVISDNVSLKSGEKCDCERLISKIKASEIVSGALESLLGDVYIAKDIDEAFSVSKKVDGNARFVTFDGHYVGSRGEIVFNVLETNKNKGILERKRKLSDLEKNLEAARKHTKELAEKMSEALRLLEEAEKTMINASTELNHAKLTLESEELAVKKLEQDIEESNKEMHDLEERRASLTQLLSQSKPDRESSVAEKEKIAKAMSELESTLTQKREKLESMRLEHTLQIEKISDLKNTKNSLLERKAYLEERIKMAKTSAASTKQESEAKENYISYATGRLGTLSELISRLEAVANVGERLKSDFRDKSSVYSSKNEELYAQLEKLREKSNRERAESDKAFRETSEIQVDRTKIDFELQDSKRRILANSSSNSIEDALSLDIVQAKEELVASEQKLAKRLAKIGSVDYTLSTQYELLKQRYDYLSVHCDDIDKTISAIKKIDVMLEERFKSVFEGTFRQVAESFETIFSRLFPGGGGVLRLVDSNESEKCGIQILANPAGKTIKKISLLSGGERSLVALTFLFALYSARKTPFYLLDEVEAALDDTNLVRLLDYIDNLRDSTQFIMITHQRRTMEMADVLFGVSMQGNGISRVITQKLSDYDEG